MSIKIKCMTGQNRPNYRIGQRGKVIRSVLALRPTLKRSGLFDEEEESILLKTYWKSKELRTRRRRGIHVELLGRMLKVTYLGRVHSLSRNSVKESR